MLPTYSGAIGSGLDRTQLWNIRQAANPRRRSRRQAPLLLLALIAVGCLSLGYQVWYSLTRLSDVAPARGQPPSRRGATSRRALAQPGAASRGAFPAPHLRRLVLVACHSVYTGLDYTHSDDESSWFLLDYQKQVPGQTGSFVRHIELGVRTAANDPQALLLFSGGKTRKAAGPRAEGDGYWLVAEAAGWYGHPEVRERTFTEDRARDSYENLLFGLCRFYELTGRYPEAVTVVGYEFKRDRFVRLHRGALRFPDDRLEYAGTPALNEAALQGEALTSSAFRSDPYGCGADLAAKRASRDPFAVGGYQADRCPGMAGLLGYCGPEQYQGALPWDDW